MTLKYHGSAPLTEAKSVEKKSWLLFKVQVFISVNVVQWRCELRFTIVFVLVLFCLGDNIIFTHLQYDRNMTKIKGVWCVV